MEEHREQLTKEKLQKIYRQLYRQLNEMVSEAYVAYADGEGRLTMAALQEQARLAWFLEEIDKACKEYLPQVGAEVQDLVETAYRQAFAGMSEAFHQGYDLAELGLNPFVAEAALQNDVVKLTLPPLLEKNRNEIAYEIKQVLNIGLMNGERYETMARRLQERLNVSYGKAENIVRTEGHRNTEKGFVDCGEQIQQGLTGSDLIYASTWRTMKDQRVRPQQRRKTKKGWKTSYSKNGANHMKLEGQTVRVGESFDLGGGVKAKAPGLSGVAAQDCRCRCFAEYNLMTVAEFAQATGQSEEKIREKYGIAVDHVDERGIINKKESGFAVVDRPIIEQDEIIEQAKIYGDELLQHPELLEYGNGDPVGSYINKKLGYDGLPKVVSASEFDSLSEGKQILYRGVTDYKDISAHDMVEQFKTGKFYSGRGVYGNGTYVDINESVAKYYAYDSGETQNGEIMQMILADDAKIIPFLDIFTEYEKTGIPKIIGSKREAYQEVIGNVGAYAAMKGYDAIALDGWQNKQHIVILNRTKVIVKE